MPIKRLTIPTFPSWPPGEWCDVDATGANRAIFGELIKPGRLMLYDVAEQLVPEGGLDLERWGLYLRIAVDGAGRTAAVAQDGRDGPPFHPAIVVIHDGGRIFEVPGAPPAFGENGVEVVGLEDGWWVWILTSPVSVWRGRLQGDGHWSQSTTWTVAPTSQGFTDGNRDGSVLMLDAVRASIPGMVCPSQDAGLAVGQAGPPDRLVGTMSAAGLFTVHSGAAFEPHTHDDGAGHWFACARTPAGPALYVMQPPFELEQPPIEPPVEPPIPPVEPPIHPPDPPKPEEPDMPLTGPPQDQTQAAMRTLREFCQTYAVSPNTNNPSAFPPGSQPYLHDEIHDNGLFISDGLQGFIFETWAPIMMDPTNTDWNAKRARADAALQSYMKRRCGDPS